jgi:hypothetical protein
MHHPFPANHSQEDDSLQTDDIDILFQKLQPIEPPPSLIARILSTIPQLLPMKPPAPQDELDRPAVGNDEAN